MKRDMKIIVGTMIFILVVCVFALWFINKTNQSKAAGFDPETGYTIETTCSEIQGNSLVCNAENDTYSFERDVVVVLQKTSILVGKDGIETDKTEYEDCSINQMKQEIAENGAVHVCLWTTPAGKITAIKVVKKSFSNRALSLAELDGLNPESYDSENVVLATSKIEIKLAPAQYDGDEKHNYERLINSYTLSKNLKVYGMTIDCTIDKDGKKTKKYSYSKSSIEKIQKDIINGSLSTVRVWFNKKGEIKTLMTYGETEVWE